MVTRIKYLICVIIFLFSSRVIAQREVIIKRSLDISCPNPDYMLNQCDYGILVPANRPGKQQILEYKYSVKPHHVLKTDAEEYFVKWNKMSFSSLNKAKLEVEIKLKISVYDLKTAKKNPVKNPADLDTLNYLKDEENLRSNSKIIQKIAVSLSGTTREEVVKKIFDHVISNMEYHIFTEQDRGAKQAAREGKGDCTEYSEFMVTLCRAKKIPARIIKGLIPKTNGQVGHHNWVEVFFPEYGWVAFDPTWADHLGSTTTFDSMRNSYIQMSNKRFIKTASSSCSPNDFPFYMRLRDSCVDLSNSMNQKFRNMVACYNRSELPNAMNLLDTLIKFEPNNYLYWTYAGMIYSRNNDFEKGLESLQKALDYSQSETEKSLSLYAMANYFALKNEKEKAVTFLKTAVDYGFSNYPHLLKDQDLDNLRAYPPFIELQNEIKKTYELKKKD